MERLISYISNSDLGDLENKINQNNNSVVLYYTLKSNCKKQRRLKVITIEKENEWYIVNSIISFSNNRHVKKLEIHENEYHILIQNIEIIVKLFMEIKEWLKEVAEFHQEKFGSKVRVINDLDFMYNNEKISYRFSVNPGGLLIRAKLLSYSRDSFIILKSIAEKCSSYRGMCIIEGTSDKFSSAYEVMPSMIRSS